MTTQLDGTAQALRERLLEGRFGAAGKLREQMLAEILSVSRTVIRLALGELEKEGLVTREPNKGYRVRSFTLVEVTDAILVRGELEGMAARLCAERGLRNEELNRLHEILKQLDRVLGAGVDTSDARRHVIDLNAAFHDGVIRASGNKSLGETITSLSRLPLVSSRAIVFDTQGSAQHDGRLVASQADHYDVLDAIQNRQGARAEHIMREHARRSAENKRISFDRMRADDLGPGLVGLALVNG
ncbi:MAG: GntR family transcriptional regulator [Arenibacterium sp.]